MNATVAEAVKTEIHGAGVKVLLTGDSGDGKTYSLRTFFKRVKEGFLIATEPGVMEVLGDISCKAGGNMHFAYIAAGNPSFDALITSAKAINNMTYEAITSVKSWAGKTEFAQFVQLLNLLAAPKCELCGKQFPSIDKWDDTMGLGLDSLSGLSLMSMDLTVGSKPAKHQGEWGVAMDNLERLINKLCFSTKCHLVLTAHLEREMDEVSGSVRLMVSTLGRKLAPKIPRYFDDVIYAYRETGQWYWGLNKSNVVTKSRHLAYGDKLAPNFGPIMDAYEKMNNPKEVTAAK